MSRSGGDGDIPEVYSPTEGGSIDESVPGIYHNDLLWPKMARRLLGRISARNLTPPDAWIPDEFSEAILSDMSGPSEAWVGNVVQHGWGNVARRLDIIHTKSLDLEHEQVRLLQKDVRILQQEIRALFLELTKNPLDGKVVFKLLAQLQRHRPLMGIVESLTRELRDIQHYSTLYHDAQWSAGSPSQAFSRWLSAPPHETLFRGMSRRPSVASEASRHPQIPVSVWLSSEFDKESVESALIDFLDVAGLEVAQALPPEIGSWFRRFIVGTKSALSTPEAQLRLKKAERALELQVLTKRQAEVDTAEAEAVAKLLTALENTPNALIQVGSVLLVKVDGVPAVRNLTLRELTFLEMNPAALRDPASILSTLQQAGDATRRATVRAYHDHGPATP